MKIEEVLKEIKSRYDSRNMDGGPGSGNWGHSGVPGQWGGSASGGGSANRHGSKEKGFTSFSKMKKEAAKEHKLSQKELAKYPVGTVMILNGTTYTKMNVEDVPKEHNPFYGQKVGDEIWYAKGKGFAAPASGLSMGMGKVAIPNSHKEEWEGKAAIQDKASISHSTTSDVKGVHTVSISNSAFAEDVIDAVYKSEKTGDPFATDQILRETSKSAWESASGVACDSLMSYTEDPYLYNDALRKEGKMPSHTAEQIDAMTEMISNSKLKEGMVLQRGIGVGGAASLLGMSKEDFEGVISGKTPPDKIIGMVGKDDGFMSCASTTGYGFTDKPVQMEIYAPAGTEAMYAEPVSVYGKGGGYDGYFSGPSDEFETVLQRGTSVVVTGLEFRDTVYGKQPFLKCSVVGQQYKKIGNE